MDTKQLITGNPKEGFYPIVQDTVTVIELNKAVLNLTSESSSEDIIAAFDSVEDFTTLLQNVRNTENIVNGVLVNDSSLVGKIFCNIIAHTTQETLYIDGVFTNQYFNITITNTDGTFSCIKNIVYLNREVGDKTNVLILSLENDLANGQKDSPVTTEVSTALKDAISTGKACVIKSANSDILANLQQIGDNVTIIMEQISKVGQTFVAVNTTITVNTATNIISDYQTGAIVLETEGDGSKFLSDDGSYKEPQQIKGGTTIIGLDKTSQNYPGIVLGELNEARGETSIAGGSASIASANFSTAIGLKCMANGNYSVALGYKAVTKNSVGIAIGSGCVSTGLRSVAIGGTLLNIHLTSDSEPNKYYISGGTNFLNPEYDINKIQIGAEIVSRTGDNSYIYSTIKNVELIDNVIHIETNKSIGTFESNTVCALAICTSLGEASFAANEGCAKGDCSASFNFSFAGGKNSFATGDYSYAYGVCSSTFGQLTESWNDYECSIGKANKSTQSDDESIATRFTIGIGSGSNYTNAVRKNAVEIKANGDGYIIGVGNYDGTNADEENTKTIQEILNGVVTTDNVLTKDNTTEFIPTGDYQPATKKYVDDKTIYTIIPNFQSSKIILKDEDYDIIKNKLEPNGSPFMIVLNPYVGYSQAICTGNKIVAYGVNISGTKASIISGDKTINPGDVYNISFTIDNETKELIFDKSYINTQRILTESEYSALGTTPETDGVLYFVTPD